MIKYANGSKEMIEQTVMQAAKQPATQPVQPASSKNGQTQSSTGLSSSNFTLKAPPKVYYDKHGRTYEENMQLYKSRKKAILGLGITSASLAAIGIPLAVVGATQYGGFEDNPMMLTGIGTCVLGGMFGIITLGTFGRSKMYQRNADEILARQQGSAYIAPVPIGSQEYEGANIQTNSGFGFKLSYQF